MKQQLPLISPGNEGKPQVKLELSCGQQQASLSQCARRLQEGRGGRGMGLVECCSSALPQLSRDLFLLLHTFFLFFLNFCYLHSMLSCLCFFVTLFLWFGLLAVNFDLFVHLFRFHFKFGKQAVVRIAGSQEKVSGQ